MLFFQSHRRRLVRRRRRRCACSSGLGLRRAARSHRDAPDGGGRASGSESCGAGAQAGRAAKHLRVRRVFALLSFFSALCRRSSDRCGIGIHFFFSSLFERRGRDCPLFFLIALRQRAQMGAAPRHSYGGGGAGRGGGGRGGGGASRGGKHASSSSSRRGNAPSPFNKKALASEAAKAERKIPTAKRIRDLTRLLAKVREDFGVEKRTKEEASPSRFHWHL